MSELAQLLRKDLHSQWRQAQGLLVNPGLSEPVLTGQGEAVVAWLAAELDGGSQLALDFANDADFGREAVANLGLGMALESVVSEFNALRTCAFALAGANQIPMDPTLLSSLNRLVDSAIAAAVKSLAEHHDRRRDESLATAVHDLRTPLTALSLATSLLERLVHPVAESDERALLDIMRLNVDKQARLFQSVFYEEPVEPLGEATAAI